MTSMLADVVNHGTAYKARAEGFTLPAAGKTGTTNDFVDAWFVGFTPKLVAGVWIGFDQPRTIIANGFAGDLAVPLWARFMKASTAADKPEWFTPPPGIVTATVCAEYSDMGDCEREATEYFARGTERTQTYVMHAPAPDGQQMAMAGEREGVSVTPLPRPVESPAPAVSAEVPPSPADVAASDETPKKKRGFWGKVFGKGGK